MAAKSCGQFHVNILFRFFSGEYLLFQYGVSIFCGGGEDKQSRKQFYAGYHQLFVDNLWKTKFSKQFWDKIVELILFRYNLSSLSPTFRHHV